MRATRGAAWSVGALAWVLSGATAAPEDPTKSVPSLPKEMQAAWQDAGARVGWMGRNRLGERSFRSETGEGKPGEVPAFRWPCGAGLWQAGTLGNLPPPGRAFGLDLSDTNVTDAALKELGILKQLRTLDL